MKKLIVLLFVLLVSACSQAETPAGIASKQPASEAKAGVADKTHDQLEPLGEESVMALDAAQLYAQKAHDVPISDVGTVVKILKDDNKGARHQRFLVKVSPHITLLFAHNIDIATRLDDIAVGDKIQFHGEYVYNPKGGVVHWTHRDPNGGRRGGYILHQGKVYE